MNRERKQEASHMYVCIEQANTHPAVLYEYPLGQRGDLSMETIPL